MSLDRSLLICGGVLIDDLAFADGKTLDGVLGGAALYALAGAALWSDDVLLVSGAGLDAKDQILPWMARAGLATRRFRLDGRFTPRNRLVYRADGTRTETPVFGPAHFERLQPQAHDLISAMTDRAAAYVFRDADVGFWRPVFDAAQVREVTLLWEISSDVCTPAHLTAIRAVAGRIDALSINLEEASGVFDTHDKAKLFEALRGLGAPVVFLRCGAEGSFVVTENDVAAVPAGAAAVVDVTGAGNAYGGGALAGLTRGAHPVRAAQMGAIAAQFTLTQHGPFEPRDALVRAKANALLGAPVR